jgi:hypothetical protein
VPCTCDACLYAVIAALTWQTRPTTIAPTDMNSGVPDSPHVSTIAPATVPRFQIRERRSPLWHAPVAGELQREAARLNRRIIAITQT